MYCAMIMPFMFPFFAPVSRVAAIEGLYRLGEEKRKLEMKSPKYCTECGSRIVAGRDKYCRDCGSLLRL